VHPANTTPNEVSQLALALRGMAVEDENNVHQNPQASGVHLTPQHRGPPVPQPRPYGVYTQPDYNSYYLHPGREPYVDYPYGYGPSDPSLYSSPIMTAAPLAGIYQGVGAQLPHPNTVTDMHRQFYDYGGARQASQFYYPAHQPVLYSHSHSPMITPQVTPLVDKKRETQVR
jgi:hypothetical protein